MDIHFYFETGCVNTIEAHNLMSKYYYDVNKPHFFPMERIGTFPIEIMGFVGFPMEMIGVGDCGATVVGICVVVSGASVGGVLGCVSELSG